MLSKVLGGRKRPWQFSSGLDVIWAPFALWGISLSHILVLGGVVFAFCGSVLSTCHHGSK